MTDDPIPLDEERRKRGGGRRGGRAAIREAVLSAEEAEASQTGADRAPSVDGVNSSRFEMKPHGLYFKSGDEKRPYRISGHFDVMSETRDDDAQAWGLLLRFPDRDGLIQTVVITRDMFAGEGAELRSVLSRRGLYINPSSAARQALNEYLSNVATMKRARVVSRTGWHRVDGVRVFVLPGVNFGTPPVEVIYQAGLREASPFGCGGTLADWRDGVAALCAGNSRLLLAVSAAFAGPLLDLVGEEGGGLHLRGGSRVGKTTALRVAASVWGGEPGGGAGAYIRQWRATGNAVEGIAAAHSDTLLPLDELGQADPKEVGDTAYMLANGMGKARSDRGGGLRAPARFRVLFLSTGELSLADKIAEAGRQIQAGQQVRLVDVPADAGAGLGLFEDLHDMPAGEGFIQALRTATARFYGTAAHAFLAYLVDRVGKEPDLPAELRRWLDALVTGWLEPYPQAGGQVRSVARRFALATVAGELATMADVTGWSAGDAEAGVSACFRHWLAERGSTGAHEDAQAVARLRAFISRHGSSRFEDWKDPSAEKHPADQGAPDASPPSERFRTVNRAGWRRWTEEAEGRHAWRYFLTPDAMKEALAGLDQKHAHKVLIERGLLLKGLDGKASGSFTPPGQSKARLYQVRASILGTDDGDA